MRKKLLLTLMSLTFLVSVTACGAAGKEVETTPENAVEEAVLEVETEKTEVAEEVESTEGPILKELSIWNQTADDWEDVYYQTKENGEWVKASWDYEKFGDVQVGDGVSAQNLELNEHYFAVKVLTTNGEERIWTYDLVFGENRDNYDGTEEVTYVEPDWEFLQLMITEKNTYIDWSYSMDASVQQSAPIELPAKVSQILIQDPIGFYDHFYYKLGQDGEWLDNWTGVTRMGMVSEENIDWFTIEDTHIAFKAVNAEGDEKVADFDLATPNPNKPSSFSDEKGINLLDMNLQDDGTYGIVMMFFE